MKSSTCIGEAFFLCHSHKTLKDTDIHLTELQINSPNNTAYQMHGCMLKYDIERNF